MSAIANADALLGRKEIERFKKAVLKTDRHMRPQIFNDFCLALGQDSTDSKAQRILGWLNNNVRRMDLFAPAKELTSENGWNNLNGCQISDFSTPRFRELVKVLSKA
jgi:hypothetical protein